MSDSIDILYNEYLENQLDLLFGKKEIINENKKYPTINIIEKNGKFSYTDSNNNPITDKWFDKAYNFDNGFGVVRNNKKINLLDIEGNLISDEWFDDYSKITDNFIAIKNEDNVNVYSVKNKSIIEKDLEDIKPLKDGYSIIRKNSKHNLLTEDGKLVSDTWYDSISNFNENYAIVKEKNKYNFIDTKGRLISSVWYDEVYDFCEGHAIVKEKNKYNFIDTKGCLISSVWYDDAFDFSEGYALIKDEKFNYIDTNGNILSQNWFDHAEDFKNGIALVQYSGFVNGEYYDLFNYLDKNGSLYKNSFKELIDYNDYCVIAVVAKTDKKQLLNKRNEEVLFEGSKHEDFKLYKINNSFTTIKNEIICTTKDLKGYDCKKGLFNFICENGNDKLSLKYEPIRVYDNYIICQKNSDLYLYNRKTQKYDYLDKVDNIEFDDYIIHNLKDNKKYLLYSKNIFDITDYYDKKLANSKYSIEKEVRILTKEEFANNKDSILNENHLTKLKNTEDKRKEDLSKSQKEEKQKVYDSLSKLELLDNERNTISRIYLGDIFYPVEDHKEIQDIFLKDGFLKHIDMSTLNFRNVKVNGLDFSDCNINLKPQEVYNKDLSQCKFERVFWSPFTDFTGVDIRGAKFSDDNDPKTMNIPIRSFKDSLYDENTTYNGKSFVELYGECKLNHKRSK